MIMMIVGGLLTLAGIGLLVSVFWRRKTSDD